MKINNDYVLKEVLNSYILMSVKKGLNVVIKLNKTSKDIFECVSKGMEYDEIVQYMLDKYDVDEKELREDIKEYIDEMISKNVFLI